MEILKLTGMNSFLKDKYGFKDFQTHACKMIYNNPTKERHDIKIIINQKSKIILILVFRYPHLGSGWMCPFLVGTAESCCPHSVAGAKLEAAAAHLTKFSLFSENDCNAF